MAEYELAVEQMGFRGGACTCDQLFNLCIIVEKAWEFSQPLYMAFIDFKKAFDSVIHQKLWEVLSHMGMSSSTVRIVKSLYRNQQASE